MRGLKVSASLLAFAGAAVLAAAAPHLAPAANSAATAAQGFPGWPNVYDGVALTELPMSAREQAFAKDFPGRISRFSDGQREIILRWVGSPTRKLHPASDCFRGIGYTITPMPLQRNSSGHAMGCFHASRDRETLQVCELIRETSGTAVWSDVSAWYWDTVWGATPGPWWSEVVAENVVSAHPSPPSGWR